MSRARRWLDLALCGVAGAVFLVPMGAIALAIRLEDGGPVVFTQERVGAGRRPFTVYKLRSMRAGRVTRVGRWIRATGLDEVLQFVNVWRGEMRVVGPRPLTGADIERFGWQGPDYDARFAAPPGITGPGQLWGTDIESTARLDAGYAAHNSALGDLGLVAVSFLANLVGKRRVRRWARVRSGSTGPIGL